MSILYKLDIVSKKINLTSEESGNEKFNSKLGVFLSVLIYMAIFGAICFFSFKFLSFDKPFVVMNEDPLNETIFENFNNIPFGVRLSDEYGRPLENGEKIYKVSFVWIVALEENNLNQKYYVTKMEPCSLEKHISEPYRELFKNLKEIESYYCTDYPENYGMQNFYGDSKDFSFAAWLINQCYGDNCESPDLIDRTLNNVFMDYFSADFTLSSYHKNPAIPKFYSGRTQVTNKSIMRVWLGIHQGEYTTDFGSVFEDKTTVNYYTLETYKEDIKPVQNQDYITKGYVQFASLTMQNHQTKTSYNRSYMKLQELLANLGGIIKGIILIGEGLFFLLAGKLKTLRMIHELSRNYKSKLFKNETSTNSNLEIITPAIKQKVGFQDDKKVNNSSINMCIPNKNNFIAKENLLLKDKMNSLNSLGQKRLKLTNLEKLTSGVICKNQNTKKYLAAQEIIVKKNLYREFNENNTAIRFPKRIYSQWISEGSFRFYIFK